MITTCHLTRNAHRLERDTQTMHRTLAYAMGRVLWAHPQQHTLIVQHDKPVDWMNVLPGVIAHSHTIDTTTPTTGAVIEWAVIANPTYAAIQPGKRGKRSPLPPAKWKSWIARKLDGAINIRTIDAERMPTGRGRKLDRCVTHMRVMFTGSGTVANQQALAKLQSEGIGPAKAYGCGLLLVQEATS